MPKSKFLTLRQGPSIREGKAYYRLQNASSGTAPTLVLQRAKNNVKPLKQTELLEFWLSA